MSSVSEGMQASRQKKPGQSEEQALSLIRLGCHPEELRYRDGTSERMSVFNHKKKMRKNLGGPLHVDVRPEVMRKSAAADTEG